MPVHSVQYRSLTVRVSLLMCGWLLAGVPAQASSEAAWPAVTREMRPFAYWWWMGSAVDTNNIARELARYRDAGLGGVHIVPIYGAKGWESNYIQYLSPRWMEMLDFTVTEAGRLGLDVDMTTGTGWCFGGPHVTDEEANAMMVSRTFTLDGKDAAAGGPDGSLSAEKFDRAGTHALMAFGPDGRRVDLLEKLRADGSLDWRTPDGLWTVYAISQKPGPQKVKRAAPGGKGWMLNLAYPQAMTRHLGWMDRAFATYQGARPRAQYHDSYEYRTDWSPVLFAEFEKRRGYRLQDELDVFLAGEPADRAARLKCDYRETLSDIMAEETLPMWVRWAHERGCITRNQAHGSPGNWLDLYAVADIPETEMFYKDRNKLISKFASSAAHVTGKPLVGAETGTWVAEHFTETLADMKYLLDDLFLSGVNHVLYHGTCYSPDEVAWPGWVFYASYEMNPRNAVWHDVGTLNAYVTRCQSVLQAGEPDNDILLYWPIHDFWHNPEGMTRKLTVHARDWFEEQPIGRTAGNLWNAGYQFDYVSDRQLAQARVSDGKVETAGGSYRVVVVPGTERMPVETVEVLANLANAGATVVFEDGLPSDVSGGGDLGARRVRLGRALHGTGAQAGQSGNTTLSTGMGTVVIWKRGELGSVAQVSPETLFEIPGLMCIRRALPDGRYYFIANRGVDAVDGWVPLATQARSVRIMDPMTASVGLAAVRLSADHQTEVRLDLPPGASIVLRTADTSPGDGLLQPQHWQAAAESTTLRGQWKVTFLTGGPELPAPVATERLASWTELGDTNAVRFAGTAVYSIAFDAPGNRLKEGLQAYELSLGGVCQSARVRLNGRDLGTLITPPFRRMVDGLKATDNVLEVEVTNTSANRIRDLDRRGVPWQTFHDINFVNLNYEKFDASDWPVADSGLLGPVTLTPLQSVDADSEAH